MVHQGLNKTLPRVVVLLLALALLVAGCVGLEPAATTYVPTTLAPADAPPPVPREFRAAWVANVANIDWPSKKGLSVAEQQAEIIRIVDTAKALNLNALIVQVRPSADAIYPSTLEPWTEYLSGEQGKAPEPFYDPLKMWVDEAHRRGIELHAWFNPYRARHNKATSPNAGTHITNTHPAVVKEYGGFQWMDPAEAVAAQRTLDVILDVVRRYDVDGVHIDDYFYPYPVNVPGATPPQEIDFPDEPAWRAYLLGGGRLSRADWRRRNVDVLIERIHRSVKAEKSWVRFGISPFGLGRPDRRPPGIAGFSQYDKLYADVELWVRNGWMDYLVPQLYWPIDQAPQAYGVLLDYWAAENTAKRHVWPGLYTSRLDATAKSWKPEEIHNQIRVTRAKGDKDELVRGHVHFSMIALLENRHGLADQLRQGAYALEALPPAYPWLDRSAPPSPLLAIEQDTTRGALLTIDAAQGEAPWQYVIRTRHGPRWSWHIIPATQGAARTIVALAEHNSEPPDLIVVSAVDRLGNESVVTALARAERGVGR